MSDHRTNGHAPEAHPGAEPIALVGIGCRFPGEADDPTSFWELLVAGTDAVTDVPDDRWDQKAFYDPEVGKTGKSHARRGGFVRGLDQFDAAFFGISPREAARMDPQQRLLLEAAWEALEDGGQVPERLAGSRAAVFVGISTWDYSLMQLDVRDRGAIDVYTNTGGSLSIAANRISYTLDLRGPSAAVDTACSSALVAVHLACKSIWQEGCTLALAGGVNALLLPDWFVGFSRLGMLSPDGRCHAFDARANGFVRGEGAGMVVLKPLSRALADGDRIYAVVRGTALNQDGHTPGMTVPSQEAQEALLRRAYHAAGIDPARVRYVEAHGTGTPVGDPIEARALGRVLSEGRPKGRPCLVGSVKTNIGHLEAGSGIAGLIKAALVLHHRRVPPNLHFVRPNPDIDFDGLRLRVPTRGEPLPEGDGPAVAGVNSFGYGGTNAHVVLEEAPHPASGRRQPAGTDSTAGAGNGRSHQPADAGRSPFLVPLSARSPEALRTTAEAWRRFVGECPEDVSLRDLAANAARRRGHHDHRLAVVAHSRGELIEQLAAFADGRPVADARTDRVTAGGRPRLAFVCAGQGPQWWAMGRQLLEQEPVFRAVIERCDEIVRRIGPWSLLEELTRDEEHSRMAVTAVSQPAIFALQAALAALWRSWGVEPEALVGHSVGEVAAAHLAGVFDLEDAVRVIYHRGRCMELAPERGRMLAAAVTADEARRLIAPHGDRVSLAAVNSPSFVTLSGEAGPLEEIARGLEARQVFCRFLQVHYAFHSSQMDPVRDELLASLRDLRPRRAKLPLFSTVIGRRVEGPELGAEYWWRNVRQTVRFAEGVGQLIDLGIDAVVELSPHPVLTTSVSECYRPRGRKVHVLPSLRRREEERATMLRSLARLWTLGRSVDWPGVVPGPVVPLRLPLYPWQRERCWYESDVSRRTRLTPPAHPLLGAPVGAPLPSWETRIDLRLAPYLADHRVQGAVIVPATAYLEMALAVGREVLGEESCRLEDVKLHNPCFLAPDQAIRLHTDYNPDDATVRISSRAAAGADGWALHCTATIRKIDGVTARRGDTASEAGSHSMTGAECYGHFRRLGLDYGPQFQGIKRVRRGDGEAMAEVRLPDGVTADDYLLHPALLDACFQAVLPADKDLADTDGALYLPGEIDELRLYRRPGRAVRAHARLREKTDRVSVADLDVYDEGGELVAQVRGLRSRRVAGRSAEEALDDLLYAYEWRAQPITATEPPGTPGSWLIFADRGGVGERLAEALRSSGAGCTLVFAGEQFIRRSEGRYEINPGRGEDTVQLLQAVLAADAPAPRGIVHLWNLDAPPADGLDTAALEATQEAGLYSVLHLVQAWDRVAGDRGTRLLLVTRGAQSVGGRPEPVAVAQSPVLGMGRVIGSEYPRLRCKLVDLDPGGSETIAPLLAELHTADDEDEVALRGGTRHVHRFVPSTGETADTVSNGEGPYRLTIPRPGTLDALTLRAVRRRPPGPGQVEMEVVAAGLNFSDVMKALGIYPGAGDGPVPLGAECAGRVAAVGEGVAEFGVGDEVLAVAPFAFGSHVTTRAELVARKPPRLSFEEAAALPIAFLTASYALDHLGRLGAGERVLIHSATGGVGLAAVQLARRAGAEVFATAGTSQKRDYLKGMGITHVMDSRSLAFADEVMAATGGRGVDVVLNSLAGEALVRGIESLADYGRFLEIGKRDVYGNSRLGLRPFRKNLSFFAIDLDRMTRERPALLGSLLRRLAEDVGAGRLDPLPCRAYPVAEAADAFRFMQQGKHVGKVVLSMQAPRGDDATPLALAPSEEPVEFRADATYLITGGLGGFGLATARWMVERGARHLVLLGRRGLHSDEARQAVAEMEARGACVRVRRADVTNEDDLAAVLAEIDRDGPPLRGVMHAAMVLEDALLVNLDRGLMRRVLAPKVNGAWNLHRQTRDRSLDFFVLFSSLSSVFGHAGQGNYAAANLFLDALAWHRRACGLPALTVNWGYLAEVGYLAQRPQLGERLQRQGVQSFTVRQALALLERCLRGRAVQVSVMRVDWSRWRGLGVTGRVSPRFAHLLERAGERVNAPGAMQGLEAVRSAPPETRRGLLDTLLRDKLARVLGTAPDRIDGGRPLLNLGIDSLMAVELRNWIEQELRVNLPIVELMRSPSLGGLIDLLLAQLDGERVPRGADATPLASPEELLARLDELPGEQVDALLGALLGRPSDGSPTL